ncbi:MAG: DNA primase [Bacteroidales bacterium]|nr:DNA primase [Bacteroidales bacterium]
MARIDQATVNKIIETADIVEVVSDYVNLKRRGSGFIGLCPFHSERTPSFSVSKTRNYCKCFSCGEGGSPVSFIMKIEQATYPEALKILAKKYGIEIQEHELTEEEKEAVTERESLFALNDYALSYFQKTLTQSQDGRDIGLAYFRERGINDAMIERFRLGYAHEQRDAFARAALAKGYTKKRLIDTGLCYQKENGDLQDRYAGRVIYPIFTVSGKVVGFGGRVLRSDKKLAKYVNSPESAIYRKSYELYGLYQAKQTIVKKDKCLLVEGYMDVISMAQRGVTNVVASSGTSLTEGQIRLIHRFTENVTLIYDSDPAGIKASLRGIDLLLAEGLNMKVVLLPDGEDPDSFAQQHTTTEVEEYIQAHEVDFITFKTRILLEGVGSDPIQRSKVAMEIVNSIAVIPNEITRTIYIGECSRLLQISEEILTRQVAVAYTKRREKEADRQQHSRAEQSLQQQPDPSTEFATSPAPTPDTPPEVKRPVSEKAAFLYPYEEELLRLALRYGCMKICDAVMDNNGGVRPMSVVEYIKLELDNDEIRLENPVLAQTLDEIQRIETTTWSADQRQRRGEALKHRDEARAAGIEEIRRTAVDVKSIDAMEKTLEEKIEADYQAEMADYAMQYVSRLMTSAPNDAIRELSIKLVNDKHQLSKIHTKYAKVETEAERLAELVPLAIFNLKEAHVECQIKALNQSIRATYAASQLSDMESIKRMMKRLDELNELKKELAKYLGERILSPRK